MNVACMVYTYGGFSYQGDALRNLQSFGVDGTQARSTSESAHQVPDRGWSTNNSPAGDINNRNPYNDDVAFLVGARDRVTDSRIGLTHLGGDANSILPTGEAIPVTTYTYEDPDIPSATQAIADFTSLLGGFAPDKIFLLVDAYIGNRESMGFVVERVAAHLSTEYPLATVTIRDTARAYQALGGAVQFDRIGNTLAVATGTSGNVGLIDVSTPSAPTVAGILRNAFFDSPITPHATEEFLYVINQDSPRKLFVFDKNDGATLRLCSSTEINAGGSVRVAVSGDYAYITSNNGGAIRIYDISNPFLVTLAASVTGLTSPRGIAVHNDALLVCDTDANLLRIYDLVDPIAPAVTATVAITGPEELSCYGDYAYVLTSSTVKSVHILDAVVAGSSNLGGGYSGNWIHASSAGLAVSSNSVSSAYKVGLYDLSAGVAAIASTINSGASPQSVIVGDRLVISTEGALFTIYDVSTLASPVEVDTLNFGEHDLVSQRIATDGAYAFATLQDSNAVAVINPLTPAIVGGAVLGQGASSVGVACVGSVALVGGPVSVPVSIASPAAPFPLGSIDEALAGKLYAHGSYVYIPEDGVSTGVIKCVDLTDPYNATVTGFADASLDGINALRPSGNYLFGTCGSTDKVVTLNITTRTTPSLLGSLSLESGAYPNDLCVVGVQVVVCQSGADQSQYIAHLEASTPAALSVWGYVPLVGHSAPDAIESSGDFAYVVCSGGSLAVIDFSTPRSPRVVGNLFRADLRGARDVLVNGDYVYVLSGSTYSVAVISVADKTSPSLVGITDRRGTDRWVYEVARAVWEAAA